jgi:hypothetical protein
MEIVVSEEIKIPCPFQYSSGKQCAGHVVRVEAYKADIVYALDDDGNWGVSIRPPRSHYHVFCSEKGNHAGYGQADDSRMKFYYQDLPHALKIAIGALP